MKVQTREELLEKIKTEDPGFYDESDLSMKSYAELVYILQFIEDDPENPNNQ